MFLLPRHLADPSATCEWNWCRRRSVASKRGKIAAHGVAEHSCGGGREGRGWVGQGCSQFTKKFDFVSATNFFKHDFYAKIQQRRVEVGFCYVLKPEDSIFGCMGGTGGGQ